MVKYIRHKDIDLNKYNHCIQNSIFPILYAEPWLLDLDTQGNWDILMYDDYNYVMPLTYYRLKRSFWKKTLVESYFGQQLGIVSTFELTQSLNDAFMEKFFELNPLVYSFNELQGTFLEKYDLIKKNNYVLNLNKPYEDLFQNYSASKRAHVRKSLRNNLSLYHSTDVNAFIKFQKESLSLNESIYTLFRKKRILNAAIQKGMGKLYNIEHNNQLIAAAFFIHYRNRIYYLQSASNDKGRKLSAMNYLLNHIIKKNAAKPINLDFEGSQIPGIAKFMECFGAVNQPYYLYKRN